MKVTVFGGSSPKPGEFAYEQAKQLGTMLARKGYDVITGGYIGTMEAVSRGAALAGGHVIGITCDQIESWRPVAPNSWVQEEIRFPTLAQRMLALIRECDVAAALPGGPGTLAEISLMWNLLLIESLPPRPLILIGAQWKTLFHTFFTEFEAYTARQHRELITFVANIVDVLGIIQDFTEDTQYKPTSKKP